jgi:carboxyl-terminal processing protease
MSPIWSRKPDRTQEPAPASPDPAETIAGPYPVDPADAATAEDGAINEGTAETAPRRPRRVAPSRVAMVLVAVLAGSALFMGGYTLGEHVATTPGTPAQEETRFGPFWDVYRLIEADYAGSPRPSADQLVQAAINGMMQSLNDPWSYYQGPTDFEQSLLNVGGQAQGIGVQVQLQFTDASPAPGASPCAAIGNGCELAIKQPISGSPAEAAGIQPGDVIVTVDGKSLAGLTIDGAAALMKGAKGTPVMLGIERKGVLLSIKIVRDVFDVPSVVTKSLANGAVAYMAIQGVNDPAFEQFRDALAKALKAGQMNIILDLRGNLGGYVADAVHVASQFIGSGTIVYQQGATEGTQEVAAEAGGIATDPSVRVAVLVDGNTASAAEIIAGALQARGRAVLIGTKTYGKGVVQEWLPLPNNFGGIHLTVARWLTPDKVWIQGVGLKPDVAVDTSNVRAGTDPVLDAGLQKLGFPAVTTASPSPQPSPSPTAG